MNPAQTLGDPIRVLLVEDNPRDAHLVREAIQEQGASEVEIRVAGSLDEAAELLAPDTTDVVLLNLDLPGSDGLDTFLRFRQIDPDVPVLVFTGLDEQEVASACLQEGAQGCLVKGEFRGDLLRTLRQALEREELRRQLEAARRDFANLVASSVDAILVVGAGDGLILHANPAAERLFNASRGQLVGKDFGHEGLSSEPLELEIPQEGGARFTAEVRAATISWRGLPAKVVTFRDVTERRFLAEAREVALTVAKRRQFETSAHAQAARQVSEASLAQSDRLANMGLLSAGVAHEINNPLSYVLLNVEILVQELPELEGGEELAELAAEAVHGARRIREIVRSLGSFSRVESDDLAPLDVHLPLRCAVDMARNEIKYRARLVENLVAVPEVRASEGRLSQVFLNLLINATQSIGEGAVEDNEIRVATRTEDGQAVIEIRDTGQGILPEDLPRLFEPFFTTKEVGVGSGLGLAISHGIVTGLGGTIEAESVPGEGSTFRIRLPLAEPEVPEVPVALSSPDPGEPQGVRILLVDDEVALTRALAQTLEDRHQVEVAGSGRAAMERLDAGDSPDVILCDLMMSDVSGADLFEWLEAEHPELARRVVFMTGGAFTRRSRDLLRRTERPVLDKPFAPEELEALLRGLAP